MVEAALLAAGEGTRLRPITKYYPKPLLPILSVPLLELILRSLKQQGIERVCINVCHLKKQITDFLSGKDFGMELHISEEEKILGTGGGIGRMRKFISGEEFIVHNGDIVTNIQFSSALAFHMNKKAAATLIIEKRRDTQDLILDAGGRIIDIATRHGREGIWFGFTGIAILNRKVFDYLPDNEFADMVDIYADMIKRGDPIFGFESNGHYWRDMGTKEKYLRIHRDMLIDRLDIFEGVSLPDSSVFIGDGSRVHHDAILSGFASIGRNCVIEEGVKLENCVVFDDTRLSKGDEYSGCVLSHAFRA